MKLIFSTISFALQVSFLVTLHFGQVSEQFKSGAGRFAAAASGKPVIKDDRFVIDSFDLSGRSYTWKKGDASWSSVTYYEVYGETRSFQPEINRLSFKSM
jgi:hypothetical protein